LADFVRDALRLTGTHLGCEHGVCGACTVLIDGAPMRGCIAYAIACDGADVRTIEGFDDDPLMQALRHAFTRHHALQCGYCTPGVLITAYDIIQRLPDADESRVREELSGNLCRCTGYVGIVEAVRSVLRNPPTRRDGLVRPSSTMRNTAKRRETQIVSEVDSASTPSGTHSSLGEPVRHASDISKPIGSEHEITLEIAPDALWPVLQDIATVVRCVPGASLTGPPTVNPVSLDMTVAIGPIRARFEGTAYVTFDNRRRTATIDGSGHDTRSRSTSHGRIELSLRPSGTASSIVTLRLHYTLRGPLAQFSRGAIVDAVVERILERFAANLASVAKGKETESQSPLGALGLAAGVVRRWLRRWLGSGNR
ncbi:MAG: 2Fe-2S iron-sulfur cluster-binding protein, partial [Gammaproteobacteria bacterium]|nr:2Fe-2S iron-sulfur cluster-binding protein [Gammaproteobacteria bacterium]